MSTNLTCNCCCECKKPFTAEEVTYYAGLDSLSDTTLCFDCQNEYERTADEAVL